MEYFEDEYHNALKSLGIQKVNQLNGVGANENPLGRSLVYIGRMSFETKNVTSSNVWIFEQELYSNVKSEKADDSLASLRNSSKTQKRHTVLILVSLFGAHMMEGFIGKSLPKHKTHDARLEEECQ